MQFKLFHIINLSNLFQWKLEKFYTMNYYRIFNSSEVPVALRYTHIWQGEHDDTTFLWKT